MKNAMTAVFLLLLAAASTPWIGYRFGGSNHAIQIPILKHYADGSLYGRDLLLESVGGYATFFFPAMARVVRALGDVELPYFVVYVAFHIATLAVLYALSCLLFGSRATAALTCFLYLANPLSLAGESSLASRLQHGHVATPLLLLSLYLHLRGRRLAAFALCGLVFNIHALYALYVFAMLVTDNLARWREDRPRPLLLGLALFGVLILPSLVWILRGSERIPPEAYAPWLQILRERSGLHTFPTTQSAGYYAAYLLLLALGMLALTTDEAAGHRPALVRFLLAIAVLCVAGLVFSEWLPTTIVLKAQLLRSTKWATYLVLLCLGRLLIVSWAWGPIARLAGLACGVGLLLQQPAFLGLSVALFLLSDPRRWPLPAVFLGAGAVVAAAAAGVMTLPEEFGLPALTSKVGEAVGDYRILACLGLYLILRAGEGKPWARAAAGLALAVTGLWIIPSLYRESRAATGEQSWNDVQRWVRDNTPRDALILSPPYREGFRVFSERAIVGEWKDGTQQFFGVRFTFAWYERMGALKGSSRAYDDFDAATILALARRYGAEYVVTIARTNYPFPKLFQNSVAAVYRIDPGYSLETSGSAPP